MFLKGPFSFINIGLIFLPDGLFHRATPNMKTGYVWPMTKMERERKRKYSKYKQMFLGTETVRTSLLPYSIHSQLVSKSSQCLREENLALLTLYMYIFTSTTLLVSTFAPLCRESWNGHGRNWELWSLNSLSLLLLYDPFCNFNGTSKHTTDHLIRVCWRQDCSKEWN